MVMHHLCRVIEQVVGLDRDISLSRSDRGIGGVLMCGFGRVWDGVLVL